MAVKFTNNARTTLAADISNSATTATVTSGSVFPVLNAGEYFYCTFDNGTNNEIVKVTARSGNTLTIVRGVDNTTARAFSTDDAAELRATAGLLTDIQENIAAKSANQTVYNATTASSATDYDIGIDPGLESNAMVFLNGVMQHHDTFSFSGSTLTFDTAPSNGLALEVIVDNLINLQSSNLTVDTFTAADVGGNPQVDFVLSDAPAGETNLIVFVDGVFQANDTYTISSTTLSMTDGVTADMTVTVYVMNPVNIGAPSDNTVTSSKLSGNITMPADLTVTGDVAFDSPTFVVDNANSRVGLGTASPSVPVDIVGEVKISSHLNMPDNAIAKFGTGSDLQIYHDGTDTWIDESGAGSLKIRGNYLQLLSPQDELFFQGQANGSSYIYHNGLEKLATTSTGIDVTGTATMDGLTVNSGGANVVASFTSTDSTGAIQLADNAGNVELAAVGNDFHIQNAGAAAKMVVLNSGNVGIGTDVPESKLDIHMSDSNGDYGRGRDGNLNLENTNTSVTEGGWLSISGYMGNTSNSGQYAMGYISGGKQTTAADGDYGGYLSFWTTSGGANGEANSGGYERMRIDSSGNVLVGQSVGEVIGVGNTTEGISLGANGRIFASYNGQAAYLNRNGTDGGMLGFYRGGTSVGSIGSIASDLFIAESNSGLRFDGENNQILPSSTTASTDGTCNLGAGSARFKDLYLSGSGYFGPSVGIGTTSPVSQLHLQDNSTVHIVGTNTGADGNTDTTCMELIGQARGYNNDISRIASIEFKTDPSLWYRGNITFNVANSDGTNKTLTPLEAMKIDSAGNLLVGATSGSLDNAGFIARPNDFMSYVNTTTDTGDRCLLLNKENATGTLAEWRYSNSTVGTITITGSSTSYNTSSDYRLKENVDYTFNALDRVAQLKPARFNFIADEDTTVDGFLAHEVQDIVPEAVTGEKDAVREEEYEITPVVLDDDGNVVTEAEMGTREVPDYQGIDQSKLVPLLTKAIQEQQTQIETLKQEIREIREGG